MVLEGIGGGLPVPLGLHAIFYGFRLPPEIIGQAHDVILPQERGRRGVVTMIPLIYKLTQGDPHR